MDKKKLLIMAAGCTAALAALFAGCTQGEPSADTFNVTVYELTNGSLNGTQRQLTVDSGEGVSFEEYYDEYLKSDEVLDTGFCYDEAFYTDEACTTAYDFDAPVTGDLTLYAKWQEETSDSIVITYHLNDGTDTIYDTDDTAIAGLFLTEPEEPVRSGYYFAGWTVGSPDGKLWDFGRDFVTGSMDLYAKWLKGYNFEAEYTNLTGKRYHGWSDDGEAQPENLVAQSDRFDNADAMKISNGALVWCLLYNGASLEFEINSDVAVDDAVLVIRMTPDGFDYELDDTEWQVLVNGERLEYGHLCMPQGNEWAELEKRPLENYLMTISLNLKAGHNTIRLLTNNNNGHDGTYHAETPLIDCLTIYSSSTLSWEECHPENVPGQTMADVDYAIEFEGDFDTNRDHAYCPLGNNK